MILAQAALVDVNGYAGYACRYTGFLPLHCVVACRMPSMVNWLLTLPDHPELQHLRADLHRKVAIGQNREYATATRTEGLATAERYRCSVLSSRV
jgi:hypothetical protein